VSSERAQGINRAIGSAYRRQTNRLTFLAFANGVKVRASHKVATVPEMVKTNLAHLTSAAREISMRPVAT
jgi:hypothetical protein